MSIPDVATWMKRRREHTRDVYVSKLSVASGSSSVPNSLWTAGPDAGAAPTTAAALSDATAGALFAVPNAVRLLAWQSEGQFSGAALLVDRLSHQGGLDATSVAVQTTNLPTAALTRYTDGVGVHACLEIYTALGATTTVATISYTNEAGTAGRTGKATLGGATYSEAKRCVEIMPEGTDKGFRSVESVTLAASTLTAGNFGVTLYRPIVLVPVNYFGSAQMGEQDALIDLGYLPEQFLAGACPALMALVNNSATGTQSYMLRLAED